MEQGRIILDEVKPFMRCHAPKADSGIGFVLRNLHAQECGAIHAAKSLEHPILITYRNTHRLAHETILTPSSERNCASVNPYSCISCQSCQQVRCGKSGSATDINSSRDRPWYPPRERIAT